ncbi:MAG: indolepyruvate oxidoreductase subunit beta [Burkholderiales bacterium]|jgi:indolepyruvate ferredoxin oxidoreductase beta subunit|nr:indolepyruvate oxidoreductase subunit beta [Burkholderiales bacterium]
MSKSAINILIVGIGGQGVMTASEILSQVAFAEGYDVKKTEVTGMSQRGGIVSSHLRVGERVYSPEITQGEVDVLVGFEAAEALRWAHYLRPQGVAMVNRLRIEPPIVSLGLFDYPQDPIGDIRKQGIAIRDFDAGAIARELGDLRLVNTIMLGAISESLPFKPETLRENIVARFRAKKPEQADLNAVAFDQGRTEAKRTAV